jgi:hypothetical protein
MAINPVQRSVQRMTAMAADDLHKHEQILAALPVWIGGGYVPFLGAIVGGVALAAATASAVGANVLIFGALGAFAGTLVGRRLAKRGTADHPVEAAALQVMLGVTRQRVLVFEPKAWGKPARMLLTFPVKDVGGVTLEKGGFFKPTRLGFLTSQGEHRYEFSGLWEVDEFVDAIT